VNHLTPCKNNAPVEAGMTKIAKFVALQRIPVMWQPPLQINQTHHRQIVLFRMSLLKIKAQ
jgi:hypothetical protein